MPVKARSGNYVVINHTHVATSNLVHKLGLGLAYQKRRLRRKLARVWLGKHIKIWTPYVFLQQLKLATSNLVYNLGLGLSYQKQRLRPNWRGPGPGEHPKKIGTPYLFLQPLKLAIEKLVHNMSSGLPCQTQVLKLN